jgi:hypothetical protein
MKVNLLPLILVKRFVIDLNAYADGLNSMLGINVEDTCIDFYCTYLRLTVY